jgi:hypothetical protein
MDNTLLRQLAKRLSLTDLVDENEPYILTKDEEDRVIENEIIRLKEFAAWKMAQMGMLEGDIDFKLSEIDWEEKINRETILWRANSAKNYGIWQKEQRKKEKQDEIDKRTELQKVWDAKRMYKLMAWASANVFGKQLVVNDDNKKLITAICFFLSRDERFETELGYSFKRGLLIRGSTGLGKTHIVRCVEQNELNPIMTLSMLDITDEIRATGEFNLVMGDKKILYLDDAGTEEAIVKYYGTNIMWFKQFIETVYLKSKDFSNLIVSTNLNFAGMGDKYGFRVASREREMFNVIDVGGQDMRS